MLIQSGHVFEETGHLKFAHVREERQPGSSDGRGTLWFTMVYIYIYVNRMIPVPDVSIGLLSEFGCVLFQRFKLALQNGAQYFPVALGS